MLPNSSDSVKLGSRSHSRRIPVRLSTVSCVIVEYFCLLNLVFGSETVFMMYILDGTPQDLSLNVSQDVWQNQAAHQSTKIYEFEVYIFAPSTEVDHL